MRIVFMGTPQFAVTILNRILFEKLNVVAVVTPIDKPAGRGMALKTSAVKDYAVEKGLKILQPEKLSDPTFVQQLVDLNPEIFVVVAFKMLPEIVWQLPKLGTFNLHASLLPQYRGAAPINWAIINGENETGVTTFLIDKQIDTGNILLSAKINIDPNDNAGTLHDKMMHVGADIVIKTIFGLKDNSIKPKPQLFSVELKSAPKLTSENTFIRWNNYAQSIHNMVRGLNPFPGVNSKLSTDQGMRSLKIIKTHIINDANSKEFGSIDTDNKSFLYVHTLKGLLSIDELQPEGKKRMQIKDFLNGFKFIGNERFM